MEYTSSLSLDVLLGLYKEFRVNNIIVWPWEELNNSDELGKCFSGEIPDYIVKYLEEDLERVEFNNDYEK